MAYAVILGAIECTIGARCNTRLLSSRTTACWAVMTMFYNLHALATGSLAADTPDSDNTEAELRFALSSCDQAIRRGHAIMI